MKLEIPILLFRLVEKQTGRDFSDHYSNWRGDYETVSLNTDMFIEEDIQVMMSEAEKRKGTPEDDKNRKVFSSLCRKYSTYKRLHAEAGEKPIKRLQDIPEAFSGFVKKNMPNGIVYTQNGAEIDPYVSISCEYTPYREDIPASVRFSFKAIKFNEIVSVGMCFYGEDLRDAEGLTINDMLTTNNLLVESEELDKLYQEHLNKYIELRPKIGDVWIGINNAVLANDSSRWSSSKFFFKEGVSPKVILDFNGREELDNSSSSNEKEQLKNSTVLAKRVRLPLHTYGEVWHLDEHQWLQIHVDNLREYEWKGEGLMDKLVLPDQDKNLIRILMNMSKMKIEDIVEGKQGGSFILATGTPGTGKTLSAEVFSEVLERGLYKVQCSQLGINVDTVEKKLKEILARASRWGAVLLLDEGDVYVRERGTDINQNAIVGVFLRTLEYYRGILFMTSNLDTQIDDAILSRATAHLQYVIPSDLERKKIWEVLSRQFEITFTMDELDELTDTFPGIVGRDIKALLKLGKMLAEGGQKDLTPELIKSVAGFVPNVNKKLRVVPKF